VEKTLEYLKIELPTIIVFNKVDILTDPDDMRAIENEFEGAIFISAQRGINLSGLLETMQRKYDESTYRVSILVPYSEMELSQIIYNTFEIEERKDEEEGSYFQLNVTSEDMEFFENKFSKYIV
jgi:50S ribosomal subunit-associated GTPase HflX